MPEIFDLEDLRARLDSPTSILCLGNGPSSEGPQIPKDCDSLFRVNWIWHDRKFLANPNLVFTGDPDVPPTGTKPRPRASLASKALGHVPTMAAMAGSGCSSMRATAFSPPTSRRAAISSAVP